MFILIQSTYTLDISKIVITLDMRNIFTMKSVDYYAIWVDVTTKIWQSDTNDWWTQTIY